MSEEESEVGLENRLLKTLFILLLLSGGLPTAFAQTNFYSLFTNGAPANRLNIVVLSEGYTASQLTNTFRTDATNAIAKFLSQAPFREYSNYFNAFAIAVPSAQSGSSHPVSGEPPKDTFFKSSYGTNDFLIRIPPNDLSANYSEGQGKVDSLMQTYMPNSGLSVLLVNDLVPGGSCGASTGTAISFIYHGNSYLVHEAGHALAELGDEYDTPFSFPDIEEPNTTRQTNNDLIKWKSWIAPTTPIPTPALYATNVGLFEGAHYHTNGWFRPRYDCIMRSFGGPPFCEVCSEALVKAIYQKVRPVDGFTPADTNITVTGTQPISFELALLHPATHSLAVQWFADGSPVNGETNLQFTVTPQALGDGHHQVRAVVVDNTPLVRNDPTKLLSQIVTWGPSIISVFAGTGGTVGGGGAITTGDSTTVTATPNSGYSFTSWTENGTVVSTSASYSFTVTGNRSLVANFIISSQGSHIAISAGTGGTVSGGGTVVTGSLTTVIATPNSGYAFTRWTENGTVVSTSASYSFTVTGNRSLVANFSVIVPSTTSKISLAVLPSGEGKVSGGGVFRTGSSRTVKATANAGFLFANWMENGVVASTNASYSFKLSGDRSLSANFVTNLFPAVKGSYTGLFFETNLTYLDSSGLITISTTAKGSFSGSLTLQGIRYPVSGQFDLNGQASKVIKRRNPLSTLGLTLSVDLTNRFDSMVGSLTNAGVWRADLAAFRAVFDAKTNKAPQPGPYTLIIPGTNSSVLPGGDSFGTLTMDTSGRLRFGGSMADGTKVSQATSISKSGDWPLYIPLYGGKGMLLSWYLFGSPTNGVSGILDWIKSGTKSRYYSNEFGYSTFSMGSRYVPPPRNGKVLGFTEGTVQLSSGELGHGITNLISIAANNRVTNLSSNKLSLVFTPSTGLFRGTVVDPAGAKSRAISFSGAVLQNTNAGKGFFLGTNQSGTVLIQP
jgi:IgA Peptidase M64/Divergent InlB B-repeat domain